MFEKPISPEKANRSVTTEELKKLILYARVLPAYNKNHKKLAVASFNR